jgi:hypothetical protein
VLVRVLDFSHHRHNCFADLGRFAGRRLRLILCLMVLSDAFQRLLARGRRLSEFCFDVMEGLHRALRRRLRFGPRHLECVVDGAEVGEAVNLSDEGEGTHGHVCDQIGGHGLVSSAFDGQEGVPEVSAEFRGVLAEFGWPCDFWGPGSRHEGRKTHWAVRPSSGYSIDPPERRLGAVLWLLFQKFVLAALNFFPAIVHV